MVYALVTAGVKSNALRMGKDEGNIMSRAPSTLFCLTNMKLSTRAMTRAIISATEAKTAALMDLDVRSTPTPATYQATGTGTDNILVVQGTGVSIENAGGHTKMGELIAGAVYQGVMEAVAKQNALVPGRNVFQRLYERHISPHELVSEAQCDCMAKKGEAVAALEEILMNPRYAGFLEAAFALSNDYRRGLILDLDELPKLVQRCGAGDRRQKHLPAQGSASNGQHTITLKNVLKREFKRDLFPECTLVPRGIITVTY